MRIETHHGGFPDGLHAALFANGFLATAPELLRTTANDAWIELTDGQVLPIATPAGVAVDVWTVKDTSNEAVVVDDDDFTIQSRASQQELHHLVGIATFAPAGYSVSDIDGQPVDVEITLDGNGALRVSGYDPMDAADQRIHTVIFTIQ